MAAESETTSATKSNPEACLFVASLNAAVSHDQLRASLTDAFSDYGELESVKVLKDWANRPYAFVQYRNVDDARKAQKLAQHRTIEKRPVRIETARVNRTLFIGKLSSLAGEQEIRDILSVYGPVESVSMVTNGDTGEVHGSAYVKFKYREDAIQAYQQLRAHSRWMVEWATLTNEDTKTLPPISPRSQHTENPFDQITETVFVGNLNPEDTDINEKTIRDKFREYGHVSNVEFFSKSFKGNNYSYAFVTFDNVDSAHHAIERANLSTWHDRKIKVQPKSLEATRVRRHTIPLMGMTRMHSRRESMVSMEEETAWSPVISSMNQQPQFTTRPRTYSHEHMHEFIPSLEPSDSPMEIPQQYYPYLQQLQPPPVPMNMQMQSQHSQQAPTMQNQMPSISQQQQQQQYIYVPMPYVMYAPNPASQTTTQDQLAMPFSAMNIGNASV